jgi:hypothetical protein
MIWTSGNCPSAVIPFGEADVVGVVAVGDFHEKARGAGDQSVGGGIEVEATVVVEAVGDGFEDVMGRRATAADDDEFWVVPSIVKTDRVGPGRMSVVLDDVYRMPTELVDVVDDLTFKVIARVVLGIRGHFSPCPDWCWLLGSKRSIYLSSRLDGDVPGA